MESANRVDVSYKGQLRAPHPDSCTVTDENANSARCATRRRLIRGTVSSAEALLDALVDTVPVSSEKRRLSFTKPDDASNSDALKGRVAQPNMDLDIASKTWTDQNRQVMPLPVGLLIRMVQRTMELPYPCLVSHERTKLSLTKMRNHDVHDFTGDVSLGAQTTANT